MKTAQWNGPVILYHASGEITKAILEDNLFVEQADELQFD
jgi:hypothetical protein